MNLRSFFGGYAFLGVLLAVLVAGAGCARIDLYEKTVAIPGHQWQSSYRPGFSFTITDTASPYQLYVTLRHSNAYNYNNIWVNLYTRQPDGKTAQARYELPLANNQQGWLGTGMDDLFDHRIALTPPNQLFYFKQAGTYTFTIQHLMREDPLLHMWNVGLRVEKRNR